MTIFGYMRRFWIKHRRTIFFVGVFGALGLFWAWCVDGNSPTISGSIRVLFQSAGLFFILWKGNEWLSVYLDKVFPWLHYPIKRFVYGILVAVFFTTGVLLLIGLAITQIYDVSFGSQMLPLYIANGVAVFMFCLFVAWQFMHAWQKLALQEEQMKNEVLIARYETLKNQVNPHFLFNSLNSLSSLIHENADLADRFVQQLSIVYRYILETRTREVVTVDEELKILEAFVFLERIRFGDNLRVEIIVSDDNRKKMVLPLVLQMLFENAIKHNAISEEEPLTIKLHDENQRLVIENNLQPKPTLRKNSSRAGLENIRSRYQIISNEEVLIEKTELSFKVKIPWLIHES